MVERVPVPKAKPGFWLWVLGGRNTMEKWVEGKLEQGFSSFFAKYLPYLMILERWSTPNSDKKKLYNIILSFKPSLDR